MLFTMAEIADHYGEKPFYISYFEKPDSYTGEPKISFPVKAFIEKSNQESIKEKYIIKCFDSKNTIWNNSNLLYIVTNSLEDTKNELLMHLKHWEKYKIQMITKQEEHKYQSLANEIILGKKKVAKKL